MARRCERQKPYPGILIKVFDGDIEPLTRAIESPRGDEYARASALEALGYLVRAKGVLSDEDMRDYLRRLRRDAAPRDESIFWLAWAMTAADLGYEDLRNEVAILMKDGFIEKRDFKLEDFDRSLEVTRNDPAGLAGFRRDSVYPLDGVIGRLESWSRTGDGGVRRGGKIPGFRHTLRQSVSRRRPQRPVPLRQRQEIQEMLPARLI